MSRRQVYPTLKWHDDEKAAAISWQHQMLCLEHRIDKVYSFVLTCYLISWDSGGNTFMSIEYTYARLEAVCRYTLRLVRVPGGTLINVFIHR